MKIITKVLESGVIIMFLDMLLPYLSVFDRVTEANGWEDLEATKMVAALLEVGSKVLDDCEDESKRSWETFSMILKTNQEEPFCEAEVQNVFPI